MIIQFCGLSGSGKTTLANRVQMLLAEQGIKCEVIDGDIYRKELCSDLGFSKYDRHQNIRRLSFVAGILANHNIIPIICAINPYEEIRVEIVSRYNDVKTVFIDCSMEVLVMRDTKQLYKNALLPVGHPQRVSNLTGVNDPFETPAAPDLVIRTDEESVESSANKLLAFILQSK